MAVTSGFSQYMENNVLAWSRGVAFPAAPANLFLALFVTPPQNGLLAGSVEVTIGTNAYARLSFTNNTTNFAAPVGNAPATSSSGANLVMATPTGPWGVVTGWGLFDAASAGNLLYYGTFAPISPGNGDTVEFVTGNLTLSIQ